MSSVFSKKFGDLVAFSQHFVLVLLLFCVDLLENKNFLVDFAQKNRPMAGEKALRASSLMLTHQESSE